MFHLLLDKMTNHTTPKISIITICYNAGESIEKTIQSVINQSYPNIEYIIIDGLSKDNTLEIVHRYKEHITTIVSEKDKGIYDAMNKGLQQATGDYIWYMHADDQIHDKETLTNAFQQHNYEDFVYGKTLMINEQGNERSLEARKPHPNDKALSWKTLRNGMVIGHQSMLVKRAIAPLYDLDYPLCGDLDWSIRCLKASKSVRDTGIYLSRFAEGGISTVNRRASLKERFAILKKHFGLIATSWQHILIVFAALKRGSIS